MAAEWAVEKEYRSKTALTLGAAMDAYIESRKNILSPRTITSYKSIRKNYLGNIMGKSLDKITGEDIQREINVLALKLSPKTVKNVHGLVSAIFKTYQPSTPLHTKLPEKRRSNLYVPTDTDIKAILHYINGTDLELPILLAAFGPMRRGEICALTSADINVSTVHVHQNMVKDENKNWIIKTPKSYAGDRFIDYPDFVAEKWNGLDGKITQLTPDDITRMFGRTLKKSVSHTFAFMISGTIMRQFNIQWESQMHTSWNAVAGGMTLY